MQLFTLVGTVLARDVFIQVGANTTADATTVFQPNNVTAQPGDTVWFNFTAGNWTATQADFAAPCIFIHDHSPLENGFDTGFRMQGNGTSSTYPVPITQANENTTYWFFDHNTCGEGGVGVINQNVSTGQTIEGFLRNAIRLNGTGAASSSLASSTVTRASASSTPTASPTGKTSSAGAARIRAMAAAPLILVGLFL
ncbi:hypothetical protein K488DRAFT_41740 [Vararia minispora EC-137]|uniref:Uncharacterized protein n=1 Tax=Vararia minispora EC-137 TaxID=1314806 RepID=A0ACB8QX90_9AGAM|nr:hypothetical protein K488DRAFT_41740 [Vararia minispora EC-137]